MIATKEQQRAGFTPEAFHAFVESRREPDWLIDRRRRAWAAYEHLPWPSRQDEEWSRTDIRLFQDKDFSLAVPDGSDRSDSADDEIRPLLSEGVTLAGFVRAENGIPHASHLEPVWSQRGVLFEQLAVAASNHPNVARPYFERELIPHGLDRFAALQAAAWSNGALLYVPKGVVVKDPLHVLSGLSGQGTDISRLLVIMGEGSEATLLTELASRREDDRGFHCGAIELFLAPGAHLRFVSLQNWGTGVWHFAHHRAVLDRDASLQWTSGALGSRLSKVNQHVLLDGVGAESQVNGVMFTEGKQHLSYHTLQHHRAPHCRSDFLYKAALQDQSRTVWRGMIKVDPGAQKTDGYQRNDNLLLSSQARADSIPGLEIQADDVRCTHGSTSGRVDEELIFYAQARGFTRQEAIRMIVTGFFQQVFDRISIDSVREALGRAIARRVREYE